MSLNSKVTLGVTLPSIQTAIAFPARSAAEVWANGNTTSVKDGEKVGGVQALEAG